MNHLQMYVAAVATLASLCLNVNSVHAQAIGCNPNQYLFTKEVGASDRSEYGYDIIRTSHNCGYVLTGAQQGMPPVIALNQTGSVFWTKEVNSTARAYVSIVESIENGQPFLVAVGHEPLGDRPRRFITTKFNATTGAVVWERELSFAPGGGEAEIITAVDVEAYNDEYYILANTFETTDLLRGKDLVVVKLDVNGFSVPAFSNHVWEQTIAPDANVDAAALKVYDNKVWVTGWTEILQPTQNIIDETFLLELDPSTGGLLNSSILRHSRDVADVHSHPNDLWVGQLQSPGTEVVIVGDLFDAANPTNRQGGFATRFNSSLAQWQSRRIVAPAAGSEDMVLTNSVDHGLNDKSAWVVAGMAYFEKPDQTTVESAYLLEFDDVWTSVSACYGMNNPESAQRTVFNAVATKGFNGPGPFSDIERGYAAVGYISENLTAGDIYLSKVDANLNTADECSKEDGPTLEPLFVQDNNRSFTPLGLADNEEGDAFSRGYIQPDNHCYQIIIESPGGGGSKKASIDSDGVRINDNLTVNMTVDAGGSVHYFLEAQHAQDVTLSITDAIGRVLHSQQETLVAGANEVLIQLPSTSSGMYYTHISTGTDSHVLSLPISR